MSINLVATDATTFYITWEEMTDHLAEDHDLDPGFTSGKTQGELERIHDRFHSDGYPSPNHIHPKKVRICGYKPHEEDMKATVNPESEEKARLAAIKFILGVLRQPLRMMSPERKEAEMMAIAYTITAADLLREGKRKAESV